MQHLWRRVLHISEYVLVSALFMDTNQSSIGIVWKRVVKQKAPHVLIIYMVYLQN